MRISGCTAIVTGAASGIGRALALRLADEGCHLALADIDDAGLSGTLQLIGKTALRISTHHLDVSDVASIKSFPGEFNKFHRGLDLLFNNAGVALGGLFEEVSEEDFEWLFNINFWGVVRMTRAFLPMLRQSADARVINLSSLFGLVAPAGQVAYSASKFAVRGFSMALAHELAGSPVGVTVVHPGGIATAIAMNSRKPKNRSQEEIDAAVLRANRMLRMPPERAAKIIVDAVRNRRERIIVGSDALVMSWIERIAPVSYWSLMSRFMK